MQIGQQNELKITQITTLVRTAAKVLVFSAK